MKRYIGFLLFVLVAAAGCMKEPEFVVDRNGAGALKDGYLIFDFGHKPFDDITVTTRSTVPTAAEDAIVNLYMIIFDNEGKRIYGRYFNLDIRKNTIADLDSENADCWYVDNQDSKTGGKTVGKVKMKAPDVDKLSAGRLYLFANIDPVMFNLSVDKLDLIETERELEKMSVTFNQESTSRTGNLLMIGSATINVTDTDSDGKGDDVSYRSDSYYAPAVPVSNIYLERMDAKVEVNVAVVPGAVTNKYDEFGNLVSRQVIDNFTPTSWRVVNLPKDSWLIARAAIYKHYNDDVPDDLAKAVKAGGYFNSSEHLFETKTVQSYVENSGYDGYIPALTTKADRTVHGFSFYMLESYPEKSDVEYKDSDEVRTPAVNLNDRDLRVKDGNGEYAVKPDGNIWAHAPKNAPYLIIEGEVQMKVNEDVANAGKPQTLNALVTYYVHLGDFGTDIDNYDIQCNTHYTYNINILGVNSIEVEVVKDNSEEGWKPGNEQQSGATGEVYIAQEEIYTFDSHFGQRVFRFRFDAVLRSLGIKVENGEVTDYTGALETLADELTWYVSSPFGREGTPDIVNDNVEVPNGLDYKWVYFLVNKRDETNPGIYSQKNMWYPGDDFKGDVITQARADELIPDNPDKDSFIGKTLMDVSQLCNYLRKQIANKAMGMENDFDANGEIYVTAFVDEYFYDADPISGEVRANLWHEFANKPMRMMHVLCSASGSRDGESSATGSVVTIRQRSIQTVYNTQTASEGWGGETVDEIKGESSRSSVGFYVSNDPNGNDDGNNNGTLHGNNSKNNGLSNSVRLWGLEFDEKNPKKWEDYLDFTKENDDKTKVGDNIVITDFMVDDKKNLRYSCMMRNRDDNGNGIIEKSEIKWYMAATEQLVTLFIGDLGLSGSSQLYNLESPVRGNYKSHVISSTAYFDEGTKGYTQWPEKVWAEEGCSVSQYNYSHNMNYISIRCVRNFKEYEDIHTESPDPPIKVTPKTGSDGKAESFTVDISNLNSASKRIKVYEELVPLDEYSEMARVYNGFETGPLGNNGNVIPYSAEKETDGRHGAGTHFSYNQYIKNYLIQGNSYCPEGYRMPNIREAAIMYNYIDAKEYPEFWKNGSYFAVCSYYHFGSTEVGGNGYDDEIKWHEDGNALENPSPQSTWGYNESRITLAKGGNRYVRCIRDIEP